MVTETDIYYVIVKFLEEKTYLGHDFGFCTPLQELYLDSLDLVEVVMQIEETYSIAMKDEDLYTLTTIGEIVSYVSKLVNKEN